MNSSNDGAQYRTVGLVFSSKPKREQEEGGRDDGSSCALLWLERFDFEGRSHNTRVLLLQSFEDTEDGNSTHGNSTDNTEAAAFRPPLPPVSERDELEGHDEETWPEQRRCTPSVI